MLFVHHKYANSDVMKINGYFLPNICVYNYGVNTYCIWIGKQKQSIKNGYY